VNRLRHLLKRGGSGKPTEPQDGELGPHEVGQLSTVFTPPQWLRDLGRTAWLLVGVFALTAGLVWLLGTTYTIVGPVVAAMIVATVTMPIVRLLARHRFPRAVGAAIVLLGAAACGVLVLVIVIGGVTSQRGDIAKHANAAAGRLRVG
jgi:predicted PurR-regulated permease PerM